MERSSNFQKYELQNCPAVNQAMQIGRLINNDDYVEIWPVGALSFPEATKLWKSTFGQIKNGGRLRNFRVFKSL